MVKEPWFKKKLKNEVFIGKMTFDFKNTKNLTFSRSKKRSFVKSKKSLEITFFFFVSRIENVFQYTSHFSSSKKSRNCKKLNFTRTFFSKEIFPFSDCEKGLCLIGNLWKKDDFSDGHSSYGWDVPAKPARSTEPYHFFCWELSAFVGNLIFNFRELALSHLCDYHICRCNLLVEDGKQQKLVTPFLRAVVGWDVGKLYDAKRKLKA